MEDVVDGVLEWTFLKGGWWKVGVPVVTLALFITFTGCGEGYSEGERTGVITKLSHKGIMVKTWEGQMNLGGTVDAGKGVVANTWDFTVSGDEILEAVQTAQRAGKPVTVAYKQWLMGPAFRTDSGYFIVKVK